ncbi:MAG: hydantoinase B/oxoprolinase family protein [Candidatus Thorarchaeota archaeon]
MIEDPISFEVIKNALVSCAREMSQALRKTAFSPNIKERRDCSCALFDSEGRLVSQSKDIPVHLGAMPLSVKACIDDLGSEMAAGSMALVNDPFSGGSHLPDLTLVAPVYHDEKRVAFVANRAHHADVGGESAGSMPGMSSTIEEEGILIEPRIIVENNQLKEERISDLLEATRTPEERHGDLSAQIAANRVGIIRLSGVADRHGWPTLLNSFDDLRDYSAKRIQSAMKLYAGEQGEFSDVLDSDGAGNWFLDISVHLSFHDNHASIDFTGTADQVKGNVNCPVASSLSAVYYVFITLFGQGIPVNEGCWRALEVKIPEGSLLNPRYPAAVSAGNVETTQRVVDTILGAMAEIDPNIVPAASQGTMNNLAIGGELASGEGMFSFYETVGGGAGAAKGIHGTDGIHIHMTNTRNTPTESLESSYPLRVTKYSIRKGSGGDGKWRGGDGIVREIETLVDGCSISIQTERRHSKPWGLAGGKSGSRGRNLLFYQGKEYQLQAKSTVIAPKGTRIRLETPGGGGWGTTE